MIIDSLRLSEKTHSFHVSVGLVLRVSLVEQKCLQCIIKFVFVQVTEGLSEQVVYPESVVCSVSVLVVVYNPKSVSERLRVHHWIECISRGIKYSQFRSV